MRGSDHRPLRGPVHDPEGSCVLRQARQSAAAVVLPHTEGMPLRHTMQKHHPPQRGLLPSELLSVDSTKGRSFREPTPHARGLTHIPTNSTPRHQPQTQRLTEILGEGTPRGQQQQQQQQQPPQQSWGDAPPTPYQPSRAPLCATPRFSCIARPEVLQSDNNTLRPTPLFKHSERTIDRVDSIILTEARQEASRLELPSTSREIPSLQRADEGGNITQRGDVVHHSEISKGRTILEGREERVPKEAPYRGSAEERLRTSYREMDRETAEPSETSQRSRRLEGVYPERGQFHYRNEWEPNVYRPTQYDPPVYAEQEDGGGKVFRAVSPPLKAEIGRYAVKSISPCREGSYDSWLEDAADPADLCEGEGGANSTEGSPAPPSSAALLPAGRTAPPSESNTESYSKCDTVAWPPSNAPLETTRGMSPVTPTSALFPEQKNDNNNNNNNAIFPQNSATSFTTEDAAIEKPTKRSDLPTTTTTTTTSTAEYDLLRFAESLKAPPPLRRKLHERENLRETPTTAHPTIEAERYSAECLRDANPTRNPTESPQSPPHTASFSPLSEAFEDTHYTYQGHREAPSDETSYTYVTPAEGGVPLFSYVPSEGGGEGASAEARLSRSASDSSRPVSSIGAGPPGGPGRHASYSSLQGRGGVEEVGGEGEEEECLDTAFAALLAAVQLWGSGVSAGVCLPKVRAALETCEMLQKQAKGDV